MKYLRRLDWRGPPLALQIMALLLAGLVVAQLVILFLTLLLPPAPTPQYGLDAIAAALADNDDDTNRARGLQRVVQAGPPDVSGQGWLVSERSRRDLAHMIGVGPERVSLAFFTPLPFAGTAIARPTLAMADDGMVAPLALSVSAQMRPAAYLQLAQFVPNAAAMRPNTMAGEVGRAMRPPARDAFPPGLFAGGVREGARMPGDWGRHDTGPLVTVDPRSGGVYIPGDNGAAVPELLRGATTAVQAQTQAQAATASRAAQVNTGAEALARSLPGADRIGPAIGMGGVPLMRQALPDASTLLPPTQAPAMTPRIAPPLLMPQPESAPSGAVVEPTPHLAPPPVVSAPAIVAAPAPQLGAPSVEQAPPIPAERLQAPAGPPIAVTPSQRSLFGLAPAPFVEGDFVAALQLRNGKWAVVQPAPAPFPNAWQRRVLLWFAVALAVTAPFGWLFARRLVKPLDRFAKAAEQLGRDPSVVIGPLDGPAEIGRAAHAFNLMQGRIRSFVDDRTAMVGAISHDLRTPLTRMRFRIEDVDADDVRDGLLEEVDEMEAMIAQVIDFIRDASNTGARERLDLRTLVDDVVEDARLVGSDVTIERADAAPVEVDVLGMRRLLDNLLENAVKYGDRARIRLTTDMDTAVAEIIDDGPGLPEDEMERVFEPFYRSEAARNSDKSGSGLGLAVCRSIARAHGGDVKLLQTDGGFRAQIRVPLAYDRPVAA
ncbi:ATP-binding protein [Sphingomonas nostoxanthinifaciens]|uniref:ATP-binding protein n=1 Tax=Sphingomonas nostoxanthinifaciens TaxID=2872652 RepID=UPI001CC1C252|nr:ATP-binding protein [Sphingomonas nostoxanthinifaciens]UAK23464.1 HAMP domain-containing protein [Sphingomonas nostoxanthinifaciens]